MPLSVILYTVCFLNSASEFQFLGPAEKNELTDKKYIYNEMMQQNISELLNC